MNKKEKEDIETEILVRLTKESQLVYRDRSANIHRLGIEENDLTGTVHSFNDTYNAIPSKLLKKLTQKPLLLPNVNS